MKATHLIVAVALAALATASCDNPTEPVTDAIQFERGHGGESGTHYNLNIIGVPQDKTADMTGNNGHRIFVYLEDKTRIYLKAGDSFEVLDANGTNDGRAEFQLPNLDVDGDGTTEYSVYARALGKPYGSSTITPCVEDKQTREEYCSVMTVIELKRRKGKSSFKLATDLLYAWLDLDGDGTEERYPLFSDELLDYYWSYDNNGLKLAQLRFYMTG